MANNGAFRDPVAFAKSLFNVELSDVQCDILRSIWTFRRIAIKGCHASGKTFVVALACLCFALRHRSSRVITLSPGWLQTKSVLWAEIHSLLARAKFRLPAINTNLTEIRLAHDNQILGISTNEAGRLSGFHAENLLFVADEAVAINEDFWPAVMGVLAGGNAALVVLSNPTVSTGFFADCFGRNAASWKRFSISAFDTPNLAGMGLEGLLALPDAALDENVASFLTTRRWVRERYAEWYSGSAENSPLWQSRVLGEFPSLSSSALIPLDLLEAARRPALDDCVSQVVVGCDVAGAGKDKTACVAVSGAAIVDSKTWADADARQPVVDWLREKDKSRGVKLVNVDSVGLGYYFCEHVRDQGFRAQGINVASKPLVEEQAKQKPDAVKKNIERFANRKAEMYWRLRQRFQRREISGLTDDMLAELAAITWLVNPQGEIQIEGKDEVRAALGHSPDLAEALLMALGTSEPQPYAYTTVTSRLSAPQAWLPPTPKEYQEEDRVNEASRFHARTRWGKWANF